MSSSLVLAFLLAFTAGQAAAQTGACCSNTTGNCTMNSSVLCSFQNNSWAGPGSTCAATHCQLVACCRDDSVGGLQCRVISDLGCSGVHLIAPTCNPYPCSPYGRCCHPDLSCVITSPENCVNGNTFTQGAPCNPACPVQSGACCGRTTGGCTVVSGASACSQSDVTFQGAGTSCTPNPCTILGACCTPNSGTCTVLRGDGNACSGGSIFAGTGTTCTPNPCPANGTCSTAQTIAAPFSAVVTTSAATLQPTPFCDGNPVNAKTVWYRVVGDGSTMTAATCGPSTHFATVINVYCAPSGACGTGNASLFCVINSSSAPPGCVAAPWGTPAQVAWATLSGVSYYLAVFGADTADGLLNFGLTSAAGGVASPCTSDRCPVSVSDITNVEADSCGAETNSTCASPGVLPFELGSPFRGTCSNAAGVRDIDYWELGGTPIPDTVGNGTTWLDFEFATEFPGIMAVFGGPCSSQALLTAQPINYRASGTACPRPPGSFQWNVPSGTPLRVLVTTVDFGGVPCVAGRNIYRLRIATSTLGACCLGSTCGLDVSSDCSTRSGRFGGLGTVCNAPGNNTTPCCRADYNQSGVISVQDIFDFLAAFFANDSRADFNLNSTLSVQDIFDFLAAYFAGCS